MHRMAPLIISTIEEFLRRVPIGKEFFFFIVEFDEPKTIMGPLTLIEVIPGKQRGRKSPWAKYRTPTGEESIVRIKDITDVFHGVCLTQEEIEEHFRREVRTLQIEQARITKEQEQVRGGRFTNMQNLAQHWEFGDPTKLEQYPRDEPPFLFNQ